MPLTSMPRRRAHSPSGRVVQHGDRILAFQGEGKNFGFARSEVFSGRDPVRGYRRPHDVQSNSANSGKRVAAQAACSDFLDHRRWDNHDVAPIREAG